MKTIVKIIVLIFVLITGALFYFLGPLASLKYHPETKWGFDIRRPSLVPRIEDNKDTFNYKGMFYKFYFNSRPTEEFIAENVFQNYQVIEDIGNGKYYFYCVNKTIYSAAWVESEGKIFIVQFNANSNVSEWIDVALRTVQPSSEHLSDERIATIKARVAKKYGLTSLMTLGLTLGASFLFMMLLVVFLVAIMGLGRRPRNYDELSAEGIMWERSSVAAAFKSKLSYNISVVYIIQTNLYFRIFSGNKEIIKIASNELMSHIEGKKATFTYSNITVKINTKYFGGDYGYDNI